MRLTGARLLWLVAAALAMVVVAEAIPSGRQRDLPAPATPLGTPSAATVAAEPLTAWAETVLARPVFSVDRRPPAKPAASAAAGPQNLPRLAGIVVSSTGRSAIFAGEGDHSTVVAEGAQVGSYRVVTIHADAVDVTGPGGARTVKPAYSNDPPPAAPPPPMAPLSAALAGFQAYPQPNSPGIPMIPQLTPNAPNLLRPQR